MSEFEQAAQPPLSIEGPPGLSTITPAGASNHLRAFLCQKTTRAPHPLALRPDAERLDRVRRRLVERLGIHVGRDKIVAIERKIQACQARRERGLPSPGVLPVCTGSKKTPKFRRQYWRSPLSGSVVTFIVDRPTMLIISIWRDPTCKKHGKKPPLQTA